MWVFRDHPQIVNATSTLAQCRVHWRSLVGRRIPEHGSAVDLLIRVGELESALSDEGAAKRDTCSILTESLRCISLSCAHLLRAAWREEEPPPNLLRQRAAERAFENVQRAALPRCVPLRTPEGYAYYSLYPEMYLAAAGEFAAKVARAPVLCLGLRSIGSSLSAVVAAELEARGWPVRSDTLRPRGEPWDRTVRIDQRLRTAWTQWMAGHCLIVDEGPGLSGSSFAGTARTMERLGFARDRITLFPSWEPEPWQLRAERARQEWTHYRKMHVPFERIWLDGGRLYPGPVRDLSAGGWRRLHYADGVEQPPVNPYHERRKYLGPEPDGSFLKFVGLGHLGTPRYRRAEILADAGFAPGVRAWRHGFLHMDRVRGMPLAPHARPAPALLDTMVRYLGTLHGHFQSGNSAPVERHLELIHTNLDANLGRDRMVSLGRFRSLVDDVPAVGVDSRMLPHEWLRTCHGYLKCDGTDHHDDHFYPGEDDLAWDIAGVRVEFGLGAGATRSLTERLGRTVGDRFLHRRLPFYTLAYLAYRIGYATMAADTLGQSPDAHRFRRLLMNYRRSERLAWTELEAAARRKHWC